MKPATRLALQGPSQELPESKDSVAPCLWGGHLGPHPPPPPPHTFQRPCRWVLQHLLPQGVNRLRASGSCFPRAPLGGEHPQHNRPAAGSRAARPRGLLPRRLGPARAFCLRGSRAAAWARASARAGHCARVCVCACQRARACVHRSWGRGGGGTLLFARLFPNMAPLLRTQEKKIQWFYQNKLLLVPEITFLNVGLVPTPGRSGRKTAFFKLLAAVGLARVPFC